MPRRRFYLRGGSDPRHSPRDYPKELLDYRRKKPTPYMKGLRFTLRNERTADPGVRLVSDEDLKPAANEGETRT